MQNVKIFVWKDFKLFLFFSLKTVRILDHSESIDMHIEKLKKKKVLKTGF